MKRVALVFDLDGTLVDSVPDLRAALNTVLRELGRRELAAGEVRGMIGDGVPALVRRGLAATGEAVGFAAAHARFVELYEADPTTLSQLYPGVAETLAGLRDGGARLAVCTNKPQAATIGVLEGLGIAGYFTAVLGGDVLPVKKPDPGHLLAAVKRLGGTPGEAAMIGDNENDYEAARGAGIPVLLMRYGYLRAPAESLAPDAWLDRFADIPEALARLG